MKQSLFLLTILVPLFLFTSCSNEKEDAENNKYDCTFEQIDDNMDGLVDETEASIMNLCSQEAFTSASEIKSNLIGEWVLIGHGEGWIPTISQPCGYITFTENEFEFKFSDGNIDAVYMQSWDIEKVEWSGGTYFRLKTEPDYFHQLFASKFCSDYFFGNAMASDGNMYLYEKVR